MPERKSELNVVFGCMTFGKEGTEPARVFDPETCREILQVFLDHGHTEIDTARTYCSGTSEQYLGLIQADKMGCKVQTKLYPTTGMAQSGLLAAIAAENMIEHTPEGLRKHLKASLEALKVKKLDMWYLHGPDRTTPYEVTLKAVNDLYKDGLFERFGVSNYYSWEVAEMVTLCRSNGWIQPTVYQGLYNVINRNVEVELFRCLRKYGMSFYAFNPLGGGFLTGRYSKEKIAEVEKGSRFDPERNFGKNYRARYFNDSTFAALEVVRAACESHGLSMAEVSLRWMNHHSAMKKEHGDSIIIGASSLQHTKDNMEYLDKGPLPETLVVELGRAWSVAKPTAANYFHP
ncbi:Aldo/keto reductase [Gonapodya prolifera JEL478]|uniref:Aldo/keto reductase n=1 Tax=Gonapodya prolifera (strain JEL478) TaxID=1344416 RepID=A0A139A7E9_GONPJ|nr:Aldo/keto reductase [Gonapodya prolifera JEL478]|eukprot:KXS12726.1 Aldo/keto reductase [Gonapodya prolifera JEL478]